MECEIIKKHTNEKDEKLIPRFEVEENLVIWRCKSMGIAQRHSYGWFKELFGCFNAKYLVFV